jgi:hypothetical protein
MCQGAIRTCLPVLHPCGHFFNLSASAKRLNEKQRRTSYLHTYCTPSKRSRSLVGGGGGHWKVMHSVVEFEHARSVKRLVHKLCCFERQHIGSNGSGSDSCVRNISYLYAHLAVRISACMHFFVPYWLTFPNNPLYPVVHPSIAWCRITIYAFFNYASCIFKENSLPNSSLAHIALSSMNSSRAQINSMLSLKCNVLDPQPRWRIHVCRCIVRSLITPTWLRFRFRMWETMVSARERNCILV